MGYFLLFRHPVVVRGRHAVGLAEKTIEGGTRQAAEFSDERYRVGGGGQQVGSMAQTVAVDEVSGCRIYVTGDIDTHQTPNYPQLFAQAKAELDDDARYWFDAAETEELMRHNLRFQQRSDFLEFFFEYFAPGTDEASGEWMTAAALLAEIKKRAGAALKVPPTVNKFARELRGLPDIQVRRSHSSDIYLVSRK